MQRPDLIDIAFKAAQSELQQYILELEAINLKLQRQSVKLQAENVTQQHRITALEDEIKELTKKHGFTFQIIEPKDDNIP